MSMMPVDNPTWVEGRGRQATSNLDHAALRQGCVPPGCEVHLPNYLLSVQVHEDKVEMYIHISASAHARSSCTRTISNTNMYMGALLNCYPFSY